MNRASPSSSNEGKGNPKPFLGIHFVNCGAYGRIYKNKRGDSYVGHCPRCMHQVRVRIGPGGLVIVFLSVFVPKLNYSGRCQISIFWPDWLKATE